MVKFKKHIPLIIVSLLLLISITINIYLKVFENKNKEVDLLEINNNVKIDGVFDPSAKYYTEITSKKFKKILAQDKTITIAVVDNSSLTRDKFIELINKISYYKNSNIYLLEISKLSKKNAIYFYELDEQLKSLESDYIITLNKEKVIAITDFKSEDLNLILESFN